MSRSDISERQRPGNLAVDVVEAVLPRYGRGHEDLAGVTLNVQIFSERGDGSSNELGGFGVAQIEILSRFHDLLRADEPRVQRNYSNSVRLQLARHVSRELVRRGFRHTCLLYTS